MGSACAQCATMEKALKPAGATAPAPELDESDFDQLGSDAGSEIAASSDGEQHDDHIKQGVVEILKETGRTLKRGKTMAMKEAINTAKKHNVDKKAIREAELLLQEHKKKQHQEEVELEVQQFFDGPHKGDIPMCEKVLAKVKEAECRAEVLDRVQGHLDVLIITRDLEIEEVKQAREQLKQSCRDFVTAAVKGDGRKTTILNTETGVKTPANLTVDPPLEHIMLAHLMEAHGQDLVLPLATLDAVNAVDDEKIRLSKGFSQLEGADRDCVVAVSYHAQDGKTGVICFMERDPAERDHFREAIITLMTITKN